VDETGSAAVEFTLVSVLLIVLLLGIAQVAVYVWVRNAATASAAEGARHAAGADVDTAAGAERARQVLASAVGPGTADRLRCTAADTVGETGLPLVEVHCRGALPVFFAPVGEALPLDVRARAVAEGTP
jgi:Flp pilus assembly protein TadG